jgi:hypothetical protein
LIDSGQGRHVPTRAFCDRLQAENTQVIYSSLMFLEAPQCWKKLYKKGALAPKQSCLDPTLDRQQAFSEADAALEGFLSAFNCQRVNITRSLMRSGSAMAALYGLNSHDALVMALLQEFHLTHLAVIDDDFWDIDYLELWDGQLIS